MMVARNIQKKTTRTALMLLEPSGVRYLCRISMIRNENVEAEKNIILYSVKMPAYTSIKLAENHKTLILYKRNIPISPNLTSRSS